jgi:hypothetical protein
MLKIITKKIAVNYLSISMAYNFSIDIPSDPSKK